MKLLIISNMAHYRAGSGVLGWGPAVREINCLAGAFDKVSHLAMLCNGPPPPTARPYSPNVTLVPLAPAGGGGFRAKLEIALRTPQYLKACLRELRRADAVYLRCPSNLGLEALLLLWFLEHPKVRWAKYAGNWRPSGREPFFFRLQRRWLENGVHGGCVTVNGEWPEQPAHVFSLHNPCLTEQELAIARNRTRHKQIGEPLRLLFAGQLRPSKGADKALRILAELRQRGWQASLDLAGDGPQNQQLRELAAHLGLATNARFHGWLSTAALQRLYQRAHFLLLPSSTEGWPKVLGEAMAFRAVPLAAAVSCIPQILGMSGAGVVRQPEDIGGFVSEIERLARDPGEWRRLAENAQRAAADFTFEVYAERMQQMLQIANSQSKATAWRTLSACRIATHRDARSISSTRQETRKYQN